MADLDLLPDEDPLANFRAVRERNRPNLTPFPGRSDSSKPLIDADDALLFAPRAAEGLLRGVVGLVDILPGVDTGIAEGTFFTGTPDTVGGGILTSATEFLAGFIPVAGALGKAGKVGKALDITKSAERAARAAGRLKTATGINIARGAAAGAIVDFSIYDGNEARLSNMLASYPALNNPVTEFLAAREDDPELVGRLRNTLEGLGLGAITDGIMLGLKGIRAGRQVRAAGGSEDAAQEAAEKAVLAEPDEAFRVLRGETPPALEDSFRVQDEAADTALELIGDERPRGVFGEGDPGDPEKLLKGLFQYSDEQVSELTARINDRISRNEAGILGDPNVNPRKLLPTELVALELEPDGANLARAFESQDVGQVFRAIEDVIGVHARRFPKGTPLATIQQMGARRYAETADLFGTTPELLGAKILADAKEINSELADLLVRLEGHRMGMVSYAARVTELADKAVRTQAGVDEDAFVRAIQTAVGIKQHVQGAVSGLGLGLRLQGEAVPRVPGIDELVDASIRGGGNARTAELAQQWLALYREGRPEQIAGAFKAMELTAGQRITKVSTEVFINSLLYGPRTLSTNALTSAMASAALVGENLLGGAIQLGAGKGSSLLRRTLGEFKSMGETFADSLRFARSAARQGTSRLDPKAAASFVDEAPTSIRPETFGVNPDSAGGRAINAISSLVRVPSTVMRGTDEFVKQFSSRMAINGELYLEAAERGLTGEDAARFVTEGRELLLHEGQLLSHDQLIRKGTQLAQAEGVSDPATLRYRAIEYADSVESRPDFDVFEQIAERAGTRAKDATFTNDLPTEGAFGLPSSGRVQQFIQEHPALKFVFPFFKTPVNLLKFAGNRQPVFTMSALAGRRTWANFRRLAAGEGFQGMDESMFRNIRELESADPNVRFAAQGRIAGGAALFGWALQAAHEGLITGRGPEDPELRAELEQAGWLPYSIRTNAIPGTGPAFVQYQRLDPWTSMIGMVADSYEFARMAGPDQQEGIELAGGMFITALSNNITQKTYLRGVADLMEAVTNPGDRGTDYIANLVGGFIPNVAAQTAQAQDPLLREVDGFVDRLRSRVPGLSNNQGRRALAPMRNLLGEQVKRSKALGEDTLGSWFNAVMPIMYREVSDDKLNRELVSLQHGFNPPRETVFGQSLREYTNAGSQDAYDRWLQLHGKVQIRGKNLRQELRKLISSRDYQALSPVSDAEFASPRVEAIRGVVRDFRDRAFDQVLKEFPDLARDIEASERRRREARTSGLQGLTRRNRTGVPTYIEQIGR